MRKGSYSEELVRMCRDEHEGDLQRVESRISPDTNVYTGVQMMAVCAAARWRRSNHAGVVLPRVEANDGVEGTKLEATVRDDFSEGHAETSVEGKKLLGPAAVFSRQTNKPSKVSSRANIRRKARSSVVQRIHDRKTPCCRNTTRRHVHSEEHAEILLRAVIGNIILIESLKDKLKACAGKIQPDAIREVDSQEGRGDLLAVDAKENTRCRCSAAPVRS